MYFVNFEIRNIRCHYSLTFRPVTGLHNLVSSFGLRYSFNFLLLLVLIIKVLMKQSENVFLSSHFGFSCRVFENKTFVDWILRRGRKSVLFNVDKHLMGP